MLCSFFYSICFSLYVYIFFSFRHSQASLIMSPFMQWSKPFLHKKQDSFTLTILHLLAKAGCMHTSKVQCNTNTAHPWAECKKKHLSNLCNEEKLTRKGHRQSHEENNLCARKSIKVQIFLKCFPIYLKQCGLRSMASGLGLIILFVTLLCRGCYASMG